MMSPTIYGYIKGEEKLFEASQIQVGDNWNWNFRTHVQMLFHLKNGVFFTGANNMLRAFKNIMEPTLNLSYWMEDIEVKDIVFYIEEQTGRVMSFLVKKYYDEVFVKENDIDTFLDEMTESDVDYGGVLVQKTDTARPEVFQLNTVAFCDQTDIEGGPIGFKHHFSPSKLRQMSKFGWGSKDNGATVTIEELITLADSKKQTAGSNISSQTTGKTIEVYIVRGALPDAYLNDSNDMEYWCNQVQIVAFYTNEKNEQEGVTLYRKEEDEGNLKFHTSKKVYGRALGRGVGESLVHPQMWTNFLEIHKMGMLEAGSKVPLYTDDPEYVNKNRIQDMENLEITTIAQGMTIRQVPTVAPANIQLFDKAISEWYEQAQLAGASFDPLMGKESASGTTFRGQNQVVQQGRGFHERRKGQRAKFVELIHREWIVPEIVKEILKGQKFLATLSGDELLWISNEMAENAWSKFFFQKTMAGGAFQPNEKDQFIQTFAQNMQKKGSKHLLEILKGEFEGVEIKIGINIANKQKDLAGMSDKLLSVFQTIVANPFIIKSPPILKLFNEIIEMSGLQPIDISGLNVPPMPARRMTETINYADLATPPNDAQKQMLSLAGIEPTAPQTTQ